MKNVTYIYINKLKTLASELKVSFLEAASAMQSAAAQMGDEKMITAIHKIKMQEVGK